ncbi:unnamed protein product, partial [Xylocopa violacea]
MNNSDGEPSGSAVPTHTSSESEVLSSQALSQPSGIGCRFPGCQRTFGKVIGRSLHEKRAHSDWYDQLCKKEPVKARWNEEEHTLLARKEAELSVQGTRFMNQALAKIFSDRSLESIKSHRKSEQYRELVKKFVLEMESTTPGIPETPVEDRSDITNYDQKIINHLKLLATPSTHDFRSAVLIDMCDSLERSAKQGILERLTLYLLDTFPVRKIKKKLDTKTPVNKNLSRRKMRRAEYARVQDLWKRNPTRCVHSLLKDHRLENPPQKEVMVPFWEKLLTETSDSHPDGVQVQQVVSDLWAPVTEKEIRSSFPRATTASGPDGITARLLRKIPIWVIERVLNIIMWCGKLPKHLRESTTTLIPKKSNPDSPADFRPITVSSVLVRVLHKILAKRMAAMVPLDMRQRSFRESDGCSENIFLLDVALRYHHAHNKPLYLASIDVAKAFDSVSHKTITHTLQLYGAPAPLIDYIKNVYDTSVTRLRLPPEVGIEIGDLKINGAAFADDLLLFASTKSGMQTALDITSEFLVSCGMSINAAKSLTVALVPVPHEKKTIVDASLSFSCGGRKLPALKRTDQWKYLGVPFSPDGRVAANPSEQLAGTLRILTSAPLKPQQRLFALRTVVLPGLHHVLALGAMRIGVLNKIDKMVRQAARRWLCLPSDTTVAYFHANVGDGGLGLPSTRWEIPKQRLARLNSLPLSAEARKTAPGRFLENEIAVVERRLMVDGNVLRTTESLRKRWAKKLYESVDGSALKESAKTPQQHRWVCEGNRFLTGRDFINLCRMRINALPTRSRTSRGRTRDRRCRAGCHEPETLNHILQCCHRTHEARIRRHNAIASYVARGLRSKGYEVEEEPCIQTEEGLRKPDIIAKNGNDEAVVIDTQINREQTDLNKTHQRKIDYYKKNSGLIEEIKKRYKTQTVVFETVTLSSRGIWGPHSAEGLLNRKIIRKSELKVISTRVLIGGLNAFRIFNATTSMTWRR